MSLPLDQHRVAPIEVSIVCTEGLVSTWYIPNEKVMNTKVSYLIKIKNFDIGHFLIQQSYDKSVHKFLLSNETY
jgi:hypothetical protein